MRQKLIMTLCLKINESLFVGVTQKLSVYAQVPIILKELSGFVLNSIYHASRLNTQTSCLLLIGVLTMLRLILIPNILANSL